MAKDSCKASHKSHYVYIDENNTFPIMEDKNNSAIHSLRDSSPRHQIAFL